MAIRGHFWEHLKVQSDAKIRDLFFVVNFLEKVPYFSISYEVNLYSDRCFFFAERLYFSSFIERNGLGKVQKTSKTTDSIYH